MCIVPLLHVQSRMEINRAEIELLDAVMELREDIENLQRVLETAVCLVILLLLFF